MTSTDAVGLTALALASLGVGALAHTLLRRPFHAMVVTAVVVAAGLQVYLKIQGYDWSEDKYAGLVLGYSAWVGFVVSGVLAIVFSLVRGRRDKRRAAEQ